MPTFFGFGYDTPEEIAAKQAAADEANEAKRLEFGALVDSAKRANVTIDPDDQKRVQKFRKEERARQQAAKETAAVLNERRKMAKEFQHSQSVQEPWTSGTGKAPDRIRLWQPKRVREEEKVAAATKSFFRR